LKLWRRISLSLISYDKSHSEYALASGPQGVDQIWYLETYRDVADARLDPVLHYLNYGWREGRDPNHDFSTSYYLRANDDVARAQHNPLIHYLRHGLAEGRSAGDPPLTPWLKIWTTGHLYPQIGCPRPPHNAPFGTSGRVKMLFTGHEATRTGAPLILLRLMEAFRDFAEVELFLFLERDGPLIDEYRRVAHVVVNRDGALYTPASPSLRTLLNTLAQPLPELAVCNSAESWRLMRELRYANVSRIVSLIHERLPHYSEEPCRVIHASSDRIIFPSKAMKSAATEALARFGDAAVIPQGLLKPDFGMGDRSAARNAIRKELGLPPEARLVLGCGTRDLRKGIDLFVQLAARLRQYVSVLPHFLWLGGDDSQTELANFVRHDLAGLNLESSVSFVPGKADPEPFFLAADVFALTSRNDPFPCVIHEAMASALPIVLFQGAGGADEAVADDCGIVVPYLDVDSMARAIASILAKPSDFASMGEKAERRVRSNYRFSDYARQIFDICKEVAQNEISMRKAGAAKIFFSQRDWSISGVNSVTGQLVKALRSRGLDARLLFVELIPSQRTLVPEIPFTLLDLGREDWSKQWLLLEEFLKAEAPCILVTNYDFKTAAISGRLPSDVGIVGVLQSDDNEYYYYAWLLGRYWNRLVAVSKAIQAKVSAFGPETAKKTVYIPNFAHMFQSQPRPLRSTEDPLRIISAGRLVAEQKRLLDLAAVAIGLDARGIPFQLRIVGDGPFREDLEAALRPLMRKGCVQLTGRLPMSEVIDLMGASDVMLLTSELEGMPLAVLEGMAQRCVPVVTDLPSGIPELVQDGRTGVVRPVGDIGGFVDALADLQSRPSVFAALSEAAFGHVIENFHIDSVVDLYEQELTAIWAEVTSGSYARAPMIDYGPFPGISVPPTLIKELHKH
jgi:glycosyltransferase involved in cell wall biosynthesis